MPAPVDLSLKERNALAKRLSAVIESTGLSFKELSRRIAKSREAQPATIETNLKRWRSAKPRTGAMDAAPNWVFDEIAKIKPALPGEVEQYLRDAVERGYVSMGLAIRAADIISDLQKEKY